MSWSFWSRNPPPSPPKTDWDAIELKRMAIRLGYLKSEGNLVQRDNVVTFAAEGTQAADDFMGAILSIMEIGRK